MHAVPQQAHGNQDKDSAAHPIQYLQTATLLQPIRQSLATDCVNQLPHRFDDKKRHRQHQILRRLRQARIDKFGKESSKKQNGFGVRQGHRQAHAKQFSWCGHHMLGIAAQVAALALPRLPTQISQVQRPQTFEHLKRHRHFLAEYRHPRNRQHQPNGQAASQTCQRPHGFLKTIIQAILKCQQHVWARSGRNQKRAHHKQQPLRKVHLLTLITQKCYFAASVFGCRCLCDLGL